MATPIDCSFFQCKHPRRHYFLYLDPLSPYNGAHLSLAGRKSPDIDAARLRTRRPESPARCHGHVEASDEMCDWIEPSRPMSRRPTSSFTKSQDAATLKESEKRGWQSSKAGTMIRRHFGERLRTLATSRSDFMAISAAAEPATVVTGV
jgi:hypothetical protein